ncbi:MAG TPA: hypothetical protein VG406_00370 [Isosphaeraceae bacterium]|nr:hypothetical protein [Isosphaeraceae bacterium]
MRLFGVRQITNGVAYIAAYIDAKLVIATAEPGFGASSARNTMGDLVYAPAGPEPLEIA